MQIDTDILITWGAIIKRYKKGEMIFLEGNDPLYYYQIIDGEVRMFNTNSDGKEYTQGIFHQGESFAEPVLFIGELYPASAITMKESTIIKIPKEQFLKILNEYPLFQMKLLKVFARRIYNKSITAREIVNNPPNVRIIGFLTYLKQKEGSPKERILIPYTRQEIANLTGLRVETVIRALMKMQKANRVEIKDHKLYF